MKTLVTSTLVVLTMASSANAFVMLPIFPTALDFPPEGAFISPEKTSAGEK